jgi:predicted amino acid racemase
VQAGRLQTLSFFSESVTSASWVTPSHRAVALRVGGSFGESVSAVSRKLFCHARQNFPKERVKARNEFSMTRGQRRPKQ